MGDLIERLEKASEGSFDLDSAISKAVHGVVLSAAPPYTSSIDHALTLVPDDHTWSLDTHERVKQFPDAWAWAMVRKADATDHGLVRGTAPTPALALCIAALKARTPKEQTRDERQGET